ncbi:MAG: hypothetical protein K2X27_00650 [Candidatus Obscuribacterales bacterium]|nr:hypothetical protein [Candidatus Obscuribacterales bacterium]
MLFSNTEIADFINENFEACWQSVRKVPLVSIDLGQGNVIKRTLNGNIATYVCFSDGRIIDILPGLYEPQAYKDRLKQLCLASKYFSKLGNEKKNFELEKYHKLQESRLRAGKTPARFIAANKTGDGEIEFVTKYGDHDKRWLEPLKEKSAYKIKALPTGDLASWQHLLDDVRLNESEMRLKIHNYFAKAGSSSKEESPAKLAGWLYKYVLHADIEDPYLGLKTVLDGTYPFPEIKANR